MVTMTATKTTVDPTAETLAAMLTENTGQHFLDSGSAYGRNWQRNKEMVVADFQSQPEGSLEFWQRDGELSILPTINVFHFLNSRLEYNRDLHNQYIKYAEENCEYWELNSAIEFVNTLDPKGIYGDNSGSLTVNTYNGEDLLSQIIQYVYWTDDDRAHVMLQIHGGCDARGGYTYPVAFDVVDDTSIFDNARASIYCDNCGKYWDTDDSCHWYPDGCCGRDHIELQNYPAVEDRPKYPRKPDPSQNTLPMELPERPDPCSDVVWVDDDDKGHCPYCGGVLRFAPCSCG